MEILIININLNWVYRLYEEYILSIKNFIIIYFKNVNIYIKYFDVNIFNENKFKLMDLNIYDKIIYTGDLNFFHNLKKMYDIKIKNLYYINIEQLSHPSYYKLFRTISVDTNIIDYSEENLKYIDPDYKNYFLIPPYFEFNNINIIDKTIDILSIPNNNYRENILNNINFDVKFNKIWIKECFGEERDNYFKKTKIYINIHGSENHLTMELIRIVNLIFKKVIIISQNSVKNELLFLKKYILIHNNPDNILKCTNEILNNYEYYYELIYGNFDPNEYYNYILKNMENFLHN